jgi:hypothetical protein
MIMADDQGMKVGDQSIVSGTGLRIFSRPAVVVRILPPASQPGASFIETPASAILFIFVFW